MSQGIPDRTRRDKTDTVDGDVILLMRVAGKDRAHPLFLEQGKILMPLLHGKVEVILRFVLALPNDRAVQKNKYVAAATGGVQFLHQPVPLLRFRFFHTILDAVGIEPDEGTALVPKSEAVIAAKGDVGRLLLPCKTQVIMVPGNGVNIISKSKSITF